MIKKLFLMALAVTFISACHPDNNSNVEEPVNGGNQGQRQQETKPKHEDEYVANTSTLEGQWRDSLHTALAKVFKDEIIVMGGYTMPIWWTIFGKKPSDGRSLYISLHGGGGTTTATNNGQWNNQKKLYQPDEGVYLCPRAITDTWDLHFRPQSDAFYEEIIHMAETYLSVNPNKVYLMGYSAGGDGVWRIAPRMADHWAAASMMAGHPGDVSLLSLRNLPFMIWCGANDSDYNRNKVCAEKIEEMDQLQKNDPEGYIHEGHIVAGKPHWMDLEDAKALPWMAKYTRNPYPNKVVWCQGDVVKEYFYWLGIPKSEGKKGKILKAEVKDNTVTILKSNYTKVRIYLNDKLVDLNKPVVVKQGDKTLFEGKVESSDAMLKKTLYTRNDPAYSFPCCVEVEVEADSE